MGFKKIVLEKSGGIAKITLNRPEVLNSMDEELLTELVAALERLERDESVNVLIITGAGRAFSAGRDAKAILEGGEWPGGPRFKVLEDFSKPVIAAVNGFCFTGALELIMCADIIIASENAVFGGIHTPASASFPVAGKLSGCPDRLGLRRLRNCSLPVILYRRPRRNGLD